MWLLFSLLWLPALAQFPVLPAVSPTCDYANAPATVTLTISGAPAGYTTQYFLVDMVTGAIAQVNPAAPTFSNVPTGNYYAVAAHYQGTLINATAGKLITQVYETNGCLKYSATVAVQVCGTACDYSAAPATMAFTANASPTAGVTTTYVLVNEANNLISQVSSTPTFSGVALGSYAVAAVYSTGALSLSVGQTLYSTTTSSTNCQGVSNTIRYKVCNPPTVAIVSPANGGTATTTPIISGTTTPNAVVTLTGGPGSVGGPVSVTADNAGNYSTSAFAFPAGPTSVTAIATNAGGTSTPAVSSFTAVGPTSHVLVQAKVFLSGAYTTTTGLMRDDLRTKGLIPLGDPYSTPTYATNFPHTAGSAGTTIASGVLSVTGNNAIVDWVFVQLRDPLSASTVVSTRAALLQRDGDIVDLDGTSPLSFTVTPGSFFLSVRHRNHLGVMEQSPVVLSGSPTLVDFTLLTTVTYGTHAQRLVSTSVSALWPGNANQNKAVIYQGSGNDLGTVLSQVLLAPGNSVPPVRTYIVVGYLASDLNLDGTTIYQGSGNELGIVLGTVLLHPANSLPPVRTFIVSEQLP